MKTRKLTYAIFVLGLLGLTVLAPAATALAARSPWDSPTLLAPQGGSTIFLPLVVSPTGNPGGGGGSAPGALWLPDTAADNSLLSTYGTSVAVDGAGGIHVGYALYTGLDGGQRPAYYAYCAANCASLASWSRVRLSDYVQDVRLALDPAGHPRLLLYTANDPNYPDNGHAYQYALCDSGCTDLSGWTLTTITTVNEIPGRRSYQNNHYFALDPQGQPAFVYTDSDGNHAGSFYAHCRIDCAAPANWSEVNLASDQYYHKASLAFTPAGQPRLALDFFTYDDGYQVYVTRLLYMGCDTDCDNAASWLGLFVERSVGDASFSLRLDSGGNPRLALYTGDYVNQPLQPFQLHYVWCDVNCFDANTSDWSQTRLGLPNNQGEGADLVLDAGNHPRMAYEMGGAGLGYAWCNANCTASGGWQTSTAEATSVIIAQYPELPKYSCPIQTWFNGKRPSLALDAAGNPRIAYDAEHWWGGYDQFGNRCEIDVPVARFTLFKQP